MDFKKQGLKMNSSGEEAKKESRDMEGNFAPPDNQMNNSINNEIYA